MTTLELESRTDEGPGTYRFRTPDGVYSADEFRDSELLLLEGCWDRVLGGLLVVQANYGVVGTVLSTRATATTLTETSARAAACCRSNLRENDATATVRLLAAVSELEDRYDTAAYAPRPYVPIPVVKQRLVDALERLSPGGTLLVAGRPETGIERCRDCLDDLGDVSTVEQRSDTSLLCATRPASLDPPTFVERTRFETTVDGVDLTLVSEPGLFSASELDHGTRLLLESVGVADGDRVLDLCCGYGPVGTYAGLTADCSVVCSDDSARATRCAERTLAANSVDAEVVTADCCDGVRDRTFDLVLSNPPTHAGAGVLRDLFGGARDVLDADGRLALVHHEGVDVDPYLTGYESVRTTATGEEHVIRVARP